LFFPVFLQLRETVFFFNDAFSSDRRFRMRVTEIFSISVFLPTTKLGVTLSTLIFIRFWDTERGRRTRSDSI